MTEEFLIKPPEAWSCPVCKYVVLNEEYEFRQDDTDCIVCGTKTIREYDPVMSIAEFIDEPEDYEEDEEE